MYQEQLSDVTKVSVSTMPANTKTEAEIEQEFKKQDQEQLEKIRRRSRETAIVNHVEQLLDKRYQQYYDEKDRITAKTLVDYRRKGERFLTDTEKDWLETFAKTVTTKVNERGVAQDKATQRKYLVNAMLVAAAGLGLWVYFKRR